MLYPIPNNGPFTLTGMPKRKLPFNKKAYLRPSRFKMDFENDSVSSLSECSSVTSLSSSTADERTEEEEILSAAVGLHEHNLVYDLEKKFVPLRTSSPIIFNSDNSSSDHTQFSDAQSDDESDGEVIFPGSDIPVSYISQRISTLSSKHALSDAATEDILKLMSDILPIPNACPTLYKFKKLTAESSSLIQIDKCTDGEIYVLPFVEQICTILKRYPDIETIPCDSNLSTTTFSDIRSGRLFPQPSPNTLYFVLNTDGFSPLLSRNVQVWPLLLSLVNLPPRLRKRMSNIVMVGFFIGPSKPPWKQFLEYLDKSLREKVFGSKILTCKVVALVADSPAKSSCCFIQNTNGT